MSKRATKENVKEWVAHDEVSEALLLIPGVAAGVVQQAQISRLGSRLREVREIYLKVTQTEAAKILGMPQSELSRIEAGTGVKGPTFTTVSSIVEKYEQYLAPSGVELALSLDVSVDSGEPIQYALAGRAFHEG